MYNMYLSNGKKQFNMSNVLEIVMCFLYFSLHLFLRIFINFVYKAYSLLALGKCEFIYWCRLYR